MDYSIKLADVRWQKKRLKIFERDNWCCTRCGQTEGSFHVHHEKYTGEPWDAPDDKLKTLCQRCHANEHKAPSNTPTLESLTEMYNQFEERLREPGATVSAINAWKLGRGFVINEAQRLYGIDLTTQKMSA